MKNIVCCILVACLFVVEQAQAKEVVLRLGSRTYLVKKEPCSNGGQEETIYTPEGKVYKRHAPIMRHTYGLIEARGRTFFCTPKSIYYFDEAGLPQNLIEVSRADLLGKIDLDCTASTEMPFFVLNQFRSDLSIVLSGFVVYTTDSQWVKVAMPPGMEVNNLVVTRCRQVGSDLFILDTEDQEVPPQSQVSFLIGTRKGDVRVMAWFDQIVYHPQMIWICVVVALIVFIPVLLWRRRSNTVVAQET